MGRVDEGLQDMNEARMQKATDELVPLADLDGEAKKLGTAPVHYSTSYEIWQGTWLGNEAEIVALKCLRTPIPKSNAVRVRPPFCLVHALSACDAEIPPPS